MKKYKVKLETTALRDIELSYVWGCEQWGVEKAKTWYRAIKGAIRTLATIPERHSIASELEQEELGDEVRKMVFQRYRILFTVKQDTVHVLHVRGAHKGEVSEEESQE